MLIKRVDFGNSIIFYEQSLLLTIRISTIGLYLVAYRNIENITDTVISCFQYPFPFLLLACETKNLLLKKIPFLKTFVLLLLFCVILGPVFRSLLREIDSGIIFLLFIFCQIFFCIDSVKASTLNEHCQVQKTFKRTEVIPLEESMLLAQKAHSCMTFGLITALLGFFGTFSRMNDDTQVLVLQAIGFISYLFVPYVLEKNNVHKSFFRAFLVMCSIFVLLLTYDLLLFFIFQVIIALLFLFTVIMVRTISITKENRSD